MGLDRGSDVVQLEDDWGKLGGQRKSGTSDEKVHLARKRGRTGGRRCGGKHAVRRGSRHKKTTHTRTHARTHTPHPHHTHAHLRPFRPSIRIRHIECTQSRRWHEG